MGPGHPNRVKLGAMSLHTAADRLGDEVFDLLATDQHIRQPLASQQQLGGQGIGLLAPLLSKAAAALAVAEHGAGDLHPLLGAHHLVGRERNGEAIEQVIANVAFLRVVRGDQQGPAGVAEAEAFPFHPVFAAAHGRQHQIDDAVVQQVQFIDIEHAAVGIRQQTRLEHGAAAGQGRGHIHRTHQPVFGDPQRDLHKRCWDHLGGGLTADALPGGGIPLLRVLRIEVATDAVVDIEDVDGRQQCVEATGQDGFTGAAPAGDHHAAEPWINRRQQQRQLERAVAGDGGQGKGSGRPVVGHRNTACHHGRVQPACARQSR